MSYNIYKADGTAVVIADNTIDEQFYNPTANGSGKGIGTQLVGRNAINYGAPVAQNFLQLTENFNGTVMPSDSTALQGQLWFNKASGTSGSLYVRKSSAISGAMANWTEIITMDNASTTTIGLATNLAGGAAGEIPVQTGVSTTGFIATGVSGYVLTSTGPGLTPEWAIASSSGSVTSVDASGGTTGLTFTGGPITGTGTLTLSGTLGISNGGTGQTTANAAVNALLPSQTSNSGKFLTTNGTNTSWASAAGIGTSGYSGISGFSGQDGAASGSGYSGVSGFSGRSGYSGVGTSGYSGAVGTGTSGYSGFSGLNGSASSSGYSGTNGASGYSGISGFSGRSGYSGTNGSNGSAGSSGFSGTSGFSGRSGYSGTNGSTGTSGYSGTDGTSGYSGKSGYSGVSPAVTNVGTISSTYYLLGNSTNGGALTPGTSVELWFNPDFGGSTKSIMYANGYFAGTEGIQFTSGITPTYPTVGSVAYNTSGNSDYWVRTGTTGSFKYFRISAAGDIESDGMITSTGDIRSFGNITAFYTSDLALKENISPISNALAKVGQLSGVTFDWTQKYMDDHGGEDGYFVRKHDAGVIAQEVEAVFPEIVATTKDGYKAVKYDRLVALLIEAVKDLKTEVDDLRKRAS